MAPVWFKYHIVSFPSNVTLRDKICNKRILVVQVKAWDKDLSSPNNKLVYRIQSGAGDKFVISPEIGVIRVAPGSNLDPDLTSPKTTRYSLNVIAIDSGTEIQRTAEVLVNITIVDVNNKPPVFIDPGTVTIRENTQVRDPCSSATNNFYGRKCFICGNCALTSLKLIL